jgi:hypothetical protein
MTLVGKSSDFWQQASFITEAAAQCNKVLASGLLEPATSTRLDAAQIKDVYTSTVRNVETSAPSKRQEDGSGATSSYFEAAIDTDKMQRLVAQLLPHAQHSLVTTTTLVQFFEQRQEERDYPVVDYAALASQPDPLAPPPPAAAPATSRAAQQATPPAVDLNDDNIFAGKTTEQIAGTLLAKLGEPEQQRMVLHKWAGALDATWSPGGKRACPGYHALCATEEALCNTLGCMLP